MRPKGQEQYQGDDGEGRPGEDVAGLRRNSRGNGLAGSSFRLQLALGGRCLGDLFGKGGGALWACGNEGCCEPGGKFEDWVCGCVGLGERFGLGGVGGCGLGSSLGKRLGETLGWRFIPGPAEDGGDEDEELVERLAKLLRGLVDLAAGDGDDEDLKEDGVGDSAPFAKDDGADQGVEVVDERAGDLQALGDGGEVIRGAEGEAAGGVELMELLDVRGVALGGWLRVGEGGHGC